MHLRDDLDATRQRQHGPRGFAEHERRDLVGLRHEAITRGHRIRGQQFDTAEQFLMLQFFIREANDGFQRGLIAEGVIPADLEHLRADETLHQPEHVGVRAALHLRHQQPLRRVQERQTVHLRESVRQELVGRVEVTAANHIEVDIPADPTRHFNAFRVADRRTFLDDSIHIHTADGLSIAEAFAL